MEELEEAGSTLPKILRQGSWRSPFAAMTVTGASDADGNSLALEGVLSGSDTASGTTARISRVDAQIGWAGRPENGASVSLAYYGDGCQPPSESLLDADLSETYVLVTAPGGRCAYEQAAANAMTLTSAAGVVVAYGQGDDVESLGGETTTNSLDQTAAVTAVS